MASPSSLPSFPALPIAFTQMELQKKKVLINPNQPLPVDFVPSAYSVICGRGKVCTDSVGNRRLKVIAGMFLERYSNASTKELKSMIVTQIMDILEEACPNQQAQFVRFSEGRWWSIDHMAAREKVGALLRDCLHTKYRSSNKAKLARRRCTVTMTTSHGSAATLPIKPSYVKAMVEPTIISVNPFETKLISDDELIFGRHFYSLGDDEALTGALDINKTVHQDTRRPKCFTSRCA
jgi:hypothetical protein